MSEIPAGARKIVELCSEMTPEQIWKGLAAAVNTPEKVALFNRVVDKVLNEELEPGRSDFAAARAAMTAAGDAILGLDRPTGPTDAFLRRSYPILRPVRH